MEETLAAELISSHSEIPIVFLSSHTEPAVVEKVERCNAQVDGDNTAASC